jgi:acylpyruvate hydrolase
VKLATIDAAPTPHIGVASNANEILDLWNLRAKFPLANELPDTLREVLAQGPESSSIISQCVDWLSAQGPEALAELRADGIVRVADEVSFCPPIPDPKLILSVGLNYWRHLEEMSGTPVPERPTAFIKSSESLLGSGHALTAPPQCPDMIDFEGEFCFVFAKECHNVTEADAMNYVAGYTIANDVSARDWVPEVFVAEGTFPAIQAWERNIMGKQLPGFTPCGPYLVTKDEIEDPHDLKLETRLNGEVMQSTSTDDLIFKLPQIIAYFAQWYRFQAGDIVTTGSPAGVGFGRDPKLFMKPGDKIEIEIEKIGTLSNTIE